MNALAFAWRSLVRQPARATLGILGVAAVGALLFDMLLLSQGLVISMRDLLERSGFDIRVSASDGLGGGPPIADAADAAATIAALSSVSAAVTLRFADFTVDVQPGSQEPAYDGRGTTERGDSVIRGRLQGVGPGPLRPWTILRGADASGSRDLVINDNAAQRLGAAPGGSVTLRASCSGDRDALPPVTFRVAGVAAFPFDTPDAMTAAGLADACGEEVPMSADVIMVTAKDDPTVVVDQIAQRRPDLRAFTNEQAIGRLEEGGFTYFRQISTVLTTVTVSFALLLITVLLTVSVNQRLGEIAALRALGFSRRRVVADVLAESVLIVGIGGVLSLPLGFMLAEGLDRILKRMPQIPENLHFFVFEPQALGIHAALLITTAIVAALYPMRIVATLPIATTLRNEVVS